MVRALLDESGALCLPTNPHRMEPSPQSSPQPENWLAEHGDHLYGYARFRLGNDDAVEDVVQEALLAAFKGWDKFEGRSSVRTWLTAILNRKIIDHFRKQKREKDHFVPNFGENDESGEFSPEGRVLADHRARLWNRRPDNAAEHAEFWEVLSDCLQKLPTDQREMFESREFDGLSTDQICEMKNVNRNHLWVILHRVRKALRRCLEARWFAT